ncbi:MAG: hypothetical protein ACI861_000638 [Paracoccaceae bacterium]|jgi:uncharacterized protein YndB with AHSA1/START domain
MNPGHSLRVFSFWGYPERMEIRKTYQLPFAVDVVFDAWVSSETVITPATSMDILPRLGGHYRLLVETPNFNSMNEGVFLAFSSNNHVRYTWEWNGDGEITEIDVTFSQDNGGSSIDLVHTGFIHAASHAMHDSGWDSYINGFKALLGRQPLRKC